MSNYTRSKLAQDGAKYVAHWLIEAAQNDTVITYGEAGRNLEKLLNIPNIFDVHMGDPAGKLMCDIHEKFPEAPLLNTLLVRQEDAMPGAGAGHFMAEWFECPDLAKDGIRESSPSLWKEYSEYAFDEVRAFQDWPDVFENVYENKYEPKNTSIAASKSKSHKGGGEGDGHKDLRLWVKDNPEKIFKRMGPPLSSDTEVELKSADRVDVVHRYDKKVMLIEVKSRTSDLKDLERGIYQCVKYRAVKEAMIPYNTPTVEAWLITQEKLSGDLSAKCTLLGIKTKVIETLSR